MIQFPEMPDMLDAQTPFSAELSHSFSAQLYHFTRTQSTLPLVGTAGMGMFATISIE